MTVHHAFRSDLAYAEFMRHFIADTLKTLGRARPRDLERCFLETFGRAITDDTLRKYADLMVVEGILRREFAANNRDSDAVPPVQRRYQMIWYMLNK